MADSPGLLGGGAGIVVNGSYCTLAAIGHDKTGELVGFTAGHCGGPGAPVVAVAAGNRGPVGNVVAVGDGLDYGVIKLDPAKVTPTANFAGFTITGIGPDPDLARPRLHKRRRQRHTVRRDRKHPRTRTTWRHESFSPVEA